MMSSEELALKGSLLASTASRQYLRNLLQLHTELEHICSSNSLAQKEISCCSTNQRTGF
jgi:hypothetical protein